MRPHLIIPALVFALLPPGSRITQAQAATSSPVSVAGARNATREELEAAAIQFDRLAASTAYGETTRGRARAQAASVRRRLAEGDFQVGNRIILRVEGSVAVNDTVTVLEGQRINVRGIRVVSLAGVLRSELEHKLLADLTEVVRNATVQARPLMRVAVFGLVSRPGYLAVPSEMTLDQVITQAGGPSTTAAADRATLVRGDTTLLDPGQFTVAVADGATLDMLGVRDGDALMVPPRGPPWDRTSTLQIVTLFASPIVTYFLVRR